MKQKKRKPLLREYVFGIVFVFILATVFNLIFHEKIDFIRNIFLAVVFTVGSYIFRFIWNLCVEDER